MNDSVKKIVLEVGGVEVSLTPEQANKLCDDLCQLLGRTAYVQPIYPWTPIGPGIAPYPQTWIESGQTITTNVSDAVEYIRVNA